MSGYFVTGNGTEVGTTIVSAVLTEALQADYWKPIQVGNLDSTDRQLVSRLITNTLSELHPETYSLSEPLSPHAAAALDKVDMSLDTFIIPATRNVLVVEGVGGVLVPLNKHQTNADLIKKLGLPVIFASHHYDGSINHTLLSLEALKARNIAVHGIIFLGDPDQPTESIILQMSGVRMLGRVATDEELTPKAIRMYANILKEVL
ncbi:MAG: dethiobiotin synthase [Bdellovibrionales bacterium]|nr:dethiobiotin synthase [Bdellovibrionales bacterium]